MAKEKGNNQYQTKTDVEKFLKSDKTFMNTRSAAEFDAFVEGAMWMSKIRQAHIDKLVERNKSCQKKILELEAEMAPWKETWEDFELKERKSKKTKKKVNVESSDDDDDLMPDFQEDDYGDITGADFID